MKSSELKLPAKLTISRGSEGGGRNTIRIVVHDPQSSCDVLEVKIGMEEFALALTSVARQPCDAVWRVANLGLKYEIKHEFVAYAPEHGLPSSDRDLAEQRALARFEKDGWMGDREDLRNWHRHVVKDGQDGFRVTFRRWVEP